MRSEETELNRWVGSLGVSSEPWMSRTKERAGGGSARRRSIVWGPRAWRYMRATIGGTGSTAAARHSVTPR